MFLEHYEKWPKTEKEQLAEYDKEVSICLYLWTAIISYYVAKCKNLFGLTFVDH